MPSYEKDLNDVRELKKSLFLNVFNHNWERIRNDVRALITKIEELKKLIERSSPAESSQLLQHLEDANNLKRWAENIELFEQEVENTKTEFSKDKPDFSSVGRDDNIWGHTSESFLKDFVLIKNFNDYKQKLDSFDGRLKIGFLVRKYQGKPFIEEIKNHLDKVEKIRSYIQTKEIEEINKSEFHKLCAGFFAPRTCGAEKLSVARKILTLANNDINSLTDEEKVTAQTGELGKLVLKFYTN